MAAWTYKIPHSPAAHEVRVLTTECKQFLRTCTGDELMREIRAMLNAQPIEIVDAIAMLDYLCGLRDKAYPPELISRTDMDALVDNHTGVLTELSVDRIRTARNGCMKYGMPGAARTIETMASSAWVAIGRAIMNRRGFLAGILAAGVAPAAVGSGILMPVRKIVTPTWMWGMDWGAAAVLVMHPEVHRALSKERLYRLEIGQIERFNIITSPRLR